MQVSNTADIKRTVIWINLAHNNIRFFIFNKKKPVSQSTKALNKGKIYTTYCRL